VCSFIKDNEWKVTNAGLPDFPEGTRIKVHRHYGPLFCSASITHYQIVKIDNKSIFVPDSYNFSTQDLNCYVNYDLPIDCNVTTKKEGSGYNCNIIKCDNGFYEYSGWPKSYTFWAILKEIDTSVLREFGKKYCKEYDEYINSKRDNTSNGYSTENFEEEVFNEIDTDKILCVIIKFIRQDKTVVYEYIDILNDDLLFKALRMIE